MFVWYFVWKAKKKSLINNNGINNHHNHRIFKSVLFIMFFVVGSWLLNTIYSTFISPFFIDNFSIQYIAPSINFLTCIIASSSNVFILLYAGSEYRRAFQRLLFSIPILGKLIKKMYGGISNTVITVKPTIHLKSATQIAVKP
ncbi:hypothetical protein Mgra_00008660 [Meloidogyne graminicola]|uniref:G_PROTEIN_RECEP_F1_2 domain-containing protein n=1 Tax=Meloidogyne graminicola TaxID=189291 RepID=A0A8S9ZEZ1_9BILA|nr:hypothetical protein Mgra_00008660 [Meloidogyne graminicola]